ncbi:MAG: sugar kinase [Flavobacteriia bacterium]|jgi:2-dehydro-3-deoxygluconokinase|nr:sugar kinase [Flavobacteriia bacterium]
MAKTICGFGELLLRLSPQRHDDLIVQSNALEINYAGAEANLLADLSNWGHPTRFVSAFPKNPLGKKAKMFLRQQGIDTQFLRFDNGRIGSYYIEHGTSIRGTQVTYDRKEAAFTHLNLGEKEWEVLLENCSHLVASGITPALSLQSENSMLNAIITAKKMNCKLVFDLNYRRSLWSPEQARKAFVKILPYVHTLVGNIGSVNDVFGANIQSNNDFNALAEATQKAMDFVASLGNFHTIAMTIRQQINASENVLGGMIKKGDEICSSTAIPTQIIDRLGGGDAFAAGILHGEILNWEIQKTTDFATAAFALTQTLRGDILPLSEKEIFSAGENHFKGHANR